MITQTSFSGSSAVSAAASLPTSNERAEILEYFLGVRNALDKNPLRVSLSASKISGEMALDQQMQRDGLIIR